RPAGQRRQFPAQPASLQRRHRHRGLASNAFLSPRAASELLANVGSVAEDVTPVTLTSPSQFRAPQPPALTSSQYAKAYKEVKVLGGLFNSARTPEQTDLALFWAANYLVLWNQVLRDIAVAHVNDIGDSVRSSRWP